MSIGKVHVVLALALVAASCKTPSKASNRSIQKVVTAEDGTVTVSTLAGSGTADFKNDAGSSAQFNEPGGVAVDSRNGNVYVADKHNPRILKVSADGTVTVSTLAGSGTADFKNDAGSRARFNGPYGVAVGSDGKIYVVDYNGHRIRKIEYKP